VALGFGVTTPTATGGTACASVLHLTVFYRSPGAWVTDVLIGERDVEVTLRPRARLLTCPCENRSFSPKAGVGKPRLHMISRADRDAVRLLGCQYPRRSPRADRDSAQGPTDSSHSRLNLTGDICGVFRQVRCQRWPAQRKLSTRSIGSLRRLVSKPVIR